MKVSLTPKELILVNHRDHSSQSPVSEKWLLSSQLLLLVQVPLARSQLMRWPRNKSSTQFESLRGGKRLEDAGLSHSS